ncbi:MAG TPA: hypothetical protein VLV45_12270 [Gemmatimonadales bacterium]|nr:hypothetical protein [Gemmatimonadales bacterium]
MTDPTTLPSSWARLRSDGPFPLRRGAWYRVSDATEIMVELEVHGDTIALPTTLFDVVDRRPDRWTVVPRPRNALLLPPPSWGEQYGVCPSCAHRVPLFGAPLTLSCKRCESSFAVAWDEGYFGRHPVRPEP